MRAGWESWLAGAVLGWGVVAVVAMLLRWFARPLGISASNAGWVLGIGLLIVVLVGAALALVVAGILGVHHIRGRTAPRVAWMGLAVGGAMLLTGWGHLADALPREVLDQPLAVNVFADAPVEARFSAWHGGVVTAEVPFALAANESREVVVGTMAPGRYILRVHLEDGRVASEEVIVSMFSLRPQVIVTAQGIHIQQRHGD